jgi:hypothetical protein
VKGANVNVEVVGVKETQAAIGQVAKGIEPSGVPMRAATIAAVDALARALGSAASSAPTPQAALVASTIEKGADGVQMGGSAPVGHRHTPARELVMGAEHGGHNFGASVNHGGYWIAPTVAREKQGETRDAIQGGVDAAIGGAGF